VTVHARRTVARIFSHSKSRNHRERAATSGERRDLRSSPVARHSSRGVTNNSALPTTLPPPFKRGEKCAPGEENRHEIFLPVGIAKNRTRLWLHHAGVSNGELCPGGIAHEGGRARPNLREPWRLSVTEACKSDGGKASRVGRD